MQIPTELCSCRNFRFVIVRSSKGNLKLFFVCGTAFTFWVIVLYLSLSSHNFYYSTHRLRRAELATHVFGGTHTEVAQRHGSSQVNARQQPTDNDTEQTKHAEEDQGTTWTASHTDHQDRAQEQQHGEEAKRGRPSDCLVLVAQLDHKSINKIELMSRTTISLGLIGTHF